MTTPAIFDLKCQLAVARQTRADLNRRMQAANRMRQFSAAREACLEVRQLDKDIKRMAATVERLEPTTTPAAQPVREANTTRFRFEFLLAVLSLPAILGASAATILGASAVLLTLPLWGPVYLLGVFAGGAATGLRKR